MKTVREPFLIARGKVIFDYSNIYCATQEELLKSELFRGIVERFVARIASKESSIFAFLNESLPHLKKDELAGYIINLLRLLSSHTSDEILSMSGEYNAILSGKEKVFEFIEGLYNFWRRFERFIYLEAPKRSQYTKNSLHHAQFIKSNEELKNLILSTYRQISENLIGKNPRVYRPNYRLEQIWDYSVKE